MEAFFKSCRPAQSAVIDGGRIIRCSSASTATTSASCGGAQPAPLSQRQLQRHGASDTGEVYLSALRDRCAIGLAHRLADEAASPVLDGSV